MRVILVGPPEERRRLRARLPAEIEIVGEASSAASARRLHGDVEAEALVTSATRADPRERDEIEEPLTPRELEVIGSWRRGCRTRP